MQRFAVVTSGSICQKKLFYYYVLLKREVLVFGTSFAHIVAYIPVKLLCACVAVCVCDEKVINYIKTVMNRLAFDKTESNLTRRHWRN